MDIRSLVEPDPGASTLPQLPSPASGHPVRDQSPRVLPFSPLQHEGRPYSPSQNDLLQQYPPRDPALYASPSQYPRLLGSLPSPLGANTSVSSPASLDRYATVSRPTSAAQEQSPRAFMPSRQSPTMRPPTGIRSEYPNRLPEPSERSPIVQNVVGRERSVSVSPKTVSMRAGHEPATPAQPARLESPRSASMGISDLLNDDNSAVLHRTRLTSEALGYVTKDDVHSNGATEHATVDDDLSNAQMNSPITKQLHSETITTNIKDIDGAERPAKKKARLNGPQAQGPRRMATPIWAQSIRKVPLRTKTTSARPPPPPVQQPALVLDTQAGPLGLLEPSITGYVPSDEIVRLISDFLYTQVILYQAIGAQTVANNPKQSAVLEIEAKFGRIIDKNTNDRLQLPVLTETVLNRDHPNLRSSFESSLSEQQNRALNDFLNHALAETQWLPPTEQNPHPQRRPRMTYARSLETDSFYDLSQVGQLNLPDAVVQLTRQPRTGGRAKVRVTHDQNSGQEIAKIVKARIADMDIFSPMSNVDWRVSVNVELSLHGTTQNLIVPGSRDVANPTRNKNRMSYSHQQYRIDLTGLQGDQNKPGYNELELEVSAAAVREQALLLEKGQANQFQDLVGGFVNNARLLARQVPFDQQPVL